MVEEIFRRPKETYYRCILIII
jgi:hypothetical protein